MLRKLPPPPIIACSRESRREKPGQEQARVFSRNHPPPHPIGSLWAGEVVTGESTPERTSKALRAILGRLGPLFKLPLLIINAENECKN